MSEEHECIGAYMQFDRVKYEQQGIGLGLAIARLLAEIFGGQLDITSQQNQGTTVRITLERYRLESKNNPRGSSNSGSTMKAESCLLSLIVVVCEREGHLWHFMLRCLVHNLLDYGMFKRQGGRETTDRCQNMLDTRWRILFEKMLIGRKQATLFVSGAELASRKHRLGNQIASAARLFGQQHRAYRRSSLSSLRGRSRPTR